jgi:hypothetical protein
MDQTNNIISIDLFGSYARNEEDQYSDYDVLIIFKDRQVRFNPDNINSFFKFEKAPSYSYYSESKIRNMFHTGHLFAWHLYLESKNFFSQYNPSFIISLGRPNQYEFNLSDSIGFLKILETSIIEIENKSSNIYFELGIAFIAIRNLGLEIGYLKNKRFDFSPFSPRSIDSSFPLSIEQLKILRLSRYISTRGLDLKIEIPNDIAFGLKESLKWFSSLINF